MSYNSNLYNIFLNTKENTKNIPIKKSVLYSTSTLFDIVIEPKFQSMNVDIINDDCLDIAMKYENPLVLNFANPNIPGLNNRGKTQEEVILKRTNLIHCLDKSFYPIPIEGLIYNPECYIVKDKNYNLLSKHHKISVISSCAINKPVIRNGKLNDKDYKITFNIIDNIFRTSILHQREVLILGALGCGMFLNPPEEISNIFKICIKKYKNCFKEIIFAIKSTSRYDDNYNIFKNNLE